MCRAGLAMGSDPVQDVLNYNAPRGGSRKIAYRDGLEVLVPLRELDYVLAELNRRSAERQEIVEYSNRYLDRMRGKIKPMLKKGMAEDTYVILARHIIVWFANEIIEGRQKLGEN